MMEMPSRINISHFYRTDFPFSGFGDPSRQFLDLFSGFKYGLSACTSGVRLVISHIDFETVFVIRNVIGGVTAGFIAVSMPE
jgi:hypothetical protein